MFNFLKKLTGGKDASKTTAADNVDMDKLGIEIMKYDGTDFVMRSTVIFPLTKTMELTISIPQPDGLIKRRRAELTLTDTRIIEDDVREYDGTLEDVSPEMQGFLQRKAEDQAHERRNKAGAEQRGGGDRATLTFAVLSRDFKNFKAVSGDLSLSGLKVFVDDAVEMGRNIEITMDFDDEQFGKIKCRADVMWCRPNDKKHAVGLKFSALTPEQIETVQNYIKFVDEYTARVMRRAPPT